MKASEPMVELSLLGQASFPEHSVVSASTRPGESGVTSMPKKTAPVQAAADRLKSTVNMASRNQMLSYLRAHPVLAGKAVVDGTLMPESTDEQTRVQPDFCSAQESEQCHRLSPGFSEKSDFTFIMPVRDSTRLEILMAFELRLQKLPNHKFTAALEHVHQVPCGACPL